MTPPTNHPIRDFFAALVPRKMRTIVQFAEEEIIIPEGPYQGLHFDTKTMFWTKLLLDVFFKGEYKYYFASGSVQSGKTLLLITILMLYYLFESKESVIFGGPDMKLVKKLYRKKVLPVLKKTRYVFEMPDFGPGSNRGLPDEITFKNGATLYFMGAGGGDEQRSGITARVVLMTEIDKMDEATGVSRETNPVSQFAARTRSYGQAAQIFGECTISYEWGRIWTEIFKNGTYTLINVKCPKCKEFHAPECEDVTGWQEAENVPEAIENARYKCPKCEREWTERDRLKALQKPVLASRGQTVTKKGKVEGEPPRTNTFGFRWNGMHNTLITLGDIAEAEYKFDRSQDEDDKKDLMQFTRALPYKPDSSNPFNLTKDLVLGKVGNHSCGMIPEGADYLIGGIDPGLYTIWWAVWAFTKDMQGYLIDRGAYPVPQDRYRTDPSHILTALLEIKEGIFDLGWYQPSGKMKKPDKVIIDSGYQTDWIYEFTRTVGNVYMPAKGLSSVQKHGTIQRWSENQPEEKDTEDKYVGHHWFISHPQRGINLVNMDGDYWKSEVHQGFMSPKNMPGSLVLYMPEQPKEHEQFARQITAEVERDEPKGKKWVIVLTNQSHGLDNTYMCEVGADILGARRIAVAKPKKKGKKKPIVIKQNTGIRTSY
jgi:phage terminase large subunit GpA-like protein